jgi:beta-phosphoglucomutase-like phosphatase (HAD superfamily)
LATDHHSTSLPETNHAMIAHRHGARPVCRAIIFDFNGTLSDDEAVLYRVYAEMFAQRGRPLTHLEYVDRLAGLSEEEIMRVWLGERDDIELLVRERIDRYCAASDGATITARTRAAVRYAAQRVPVAIVSGAATVEIERVVRAAAIDDAFTAIVAADEISNGKPHPEGYEVALAALAGRVAGLAAGEVTVFEDTEAGVAAAKAAGMRCIAVLGTLPAHRLGQADEVIEAIDEAVIRRLFG